MSSERGLIISGTGRKILQRALDYIMDEARARHGEAPDEVTEAYRKMGEQAKAGNITERNCHDLLSVLELAEDIASRKVLDATEEEQAEADREMKALSRELRARPHHRSSLWKRRIEKCPLIRDISIRGDTEMFAREIRQSLKDRAKPTIN